MADDARLETCPRCGASMEAGFCHRAAGLSFVAPGNFDYFVSRDEDLVQAGFRKYLPSWAEYYRSYLCRSCSLYIVDYSRSLDHGAATELAPALAGQAVGHAG